MRRLFQSGERLVGGGAYLSKYDNWELYHNEADGHDTASLFRDVVFVFVSLFSKTSVSSRAKLACENKRGARERKYDFLLLLPLFPCAGGQ